MWPVNVSSKTAALDWNESQAELMAWLVASWSNSAKMLLFQRKMCHVFQIFMICSKIPYHCVHHPLHHHSWQMPSLYHRYFLIFLIRLCYLFFSWCALLGVCISCKINDIVRQVNCANSWVRELDIGSLGGEDYDKTMVLVLWRYLKYMSCRRQFSLDQYHLTDPFQSAAVLASPSLLDTTPPHRGNPSARIIQG